MTFFAHSGNGSDDWHALDVHLRGTAALARGFADVFGADALAEHLGLVHDVGKGRCAWQEGLVRAAAVGGRVGIDHKLAGTWLACDAAGLGQFALAVRGHHGGLDRPRVLKDDLMAAEGAERDRVMEAVKAVAELVPEILEDRRSALPEWCAGDAHGAELLLRMVFSALVDADFLDTEAHFTGTLRPQMPLLSSMADSYEQAREDYLGGAEPSHVNRIRAEIYEQAVAAAAQPTGVFPLLAASRSTMLLTMGCGG
jgi:CRISPR-associated endonuclease/helicase Cas3